MRTKTLYIILVVVALVIFCIISTFFGIVPLDTLPINFFGAALGALIGALITFILLKGQKDFEENKDKNIKILERKMVIFQDYIKDVWDVWSDQKITLKEFQNLTSKYYQNLMIYLKNKNNQENRLEKIGNYLSEMGKCIDKPEKVDTLREQIVGIINELSEELELGGKVNTNIMNTHDEIVFPLLFKNEILKALNKQLPMDILDEGRYELFREGKWNLEHICFNFKEYEGCKMIIGDFTGKEAIFFVLVVDNKYQLEKNIRSDGIYCQRIKATAVNLSNPIINNEFDELDKEKAPPIDFTKSESMEKYRKNKRNFADVLANRAYYWFEKIKIEDLSIVDFLKKNIGKKDA